MSTMSREAKRREAGQVRGERTGMKIVAFDMIMRTCVEEAMGYEC